MQDSTLLLGLGLAVDGAIGLFAAYWAFDIRKAMAVPAYKSQALGVALLALAPPVVQVTQTLVFFQSTFLYNSLSILAPDFAVLAIFYWTDASIRTGRRSDPLLRDPFRWRSTRVVISVLLVVTMALGFAVGINASYGPSSFLYTVGFFPIVLGLGTSVVALPLVARMSHDVALRRQLLWFGLFALSILLVTVLLSNFVFADYLDLLVQDLGVALGGFCLYKSAKSLVPLNRISPLDLGGAVQ